MISQQRQQQDLESKIQTARNESAYYVKAQIRGKLRQLKYIDESTIEKIIYDVLGED